MDLGTLLPRHARYRGEHLALVASGRELTYRQLNDYVNRLANALIKAGLGKGDKFATILNNGLPLMAAYWAAARSGTVIVPVSPLLQENGLLTLLDDPDARLVISDATFAPILRRLHDRLPAIAAGR